MRRKPAHCSKVRWPRRGDLQQIACGSRTGRSASRCATIASAIERAEAGDARQQRRRGGVEIDADGVHRVFHHAHRASGDSLLLVDIVLILADADRFRLDLDEFGQRILQAARDGDGAAQRHVEAREFQRPRFPRPNRPRRRLPRR